MSTHNKSIVISILRGKQAHVNYRYFLYVYSYYIVHILIVMKRVNQWDY